LNVASSTKTFNTDGYADKTAKLRKKRLLEHCTTQMKPSCRTRLTRAHDGRHPHRRLPRDYASMPSDLGVEGQSYTACVSYSCQDIRPYDDTRGLVAIEMEAIPRIEWIGQWNPQLWYWICVSIRCCYPGSGFVTSDQVLADCSSRYISCS
jgi:hypothetical protein